MDAEGVVNDVVFTNEELSTQAGNNDWVGQPWVETVTTESRAKIEALLAPPKNGSTRPRQVNHSVNGGPDIPILYATRRLANSGATIALGRDLREMALLQQRLLDTQLSLERDYARLRQTETRYRLLFQLSSEAVLIVDANTRRVTEANPAAIQLLGPAATTASRGFPDGLGNEAAARVEELLGRVRAVGGSATTELSVGPEEQPYGLAASLFRQDDRAYFLIRLSASGTQARAEDRGADLANALEQLPDGFLILDEKGAISYANQAFLDMAELTEYGQASGQPADRWLGRAAIDFNVLRANIRQHGSVRSFGTRVRGELGGKTDVDVAAVLVEDDHAAMALSLRRVTPATPTDVLANRELPRSVDQLTQLVGRVPLKELVRESTDLIERLCIEAALVISGDNRASAAEMLGLSRQTLYMKLRRYGLAKGAGNESKED